MMKLLQSKWFNDYGAVLVLLLLFGYFSVATWTVVHPVSEGAAEDLGDRIIASNPKAGVFIVVRDNDEEIAFAASLKEKLEEGGCSVLGSLVYKAPSDIVAKLREFCESNATVDFVAATHEAAANNVLRPPPGKEKPGQLPDLAKRYPTLAKAVVIEPDSYQWTRFLTQDNIFKIANHISYTAIIAIGMTMVIITAGIDLSVGSLMAFGAVVVAWLIQHLGGGVQAGALSLISCTLGAILACGAFGVFSGIMVTAFRIPAFIVTLGVMMVARGLAHIIAGIEPIKVKAASFDWLGGQSSLLGIPNPVTLMIILFVLGHILMTRTAFGRYVYAVGGNPEAARLSGVPVRRTLIVVYGLCGLLAGLAGVINASLFTSGNPKFGVGEELTVIAAVVVGGTSLAGGEGRILGTLIGALIIAVIYSGMNQTGVGEHGQKVVFGLLIIGAVLLDVLKKRGAKAA